MKRKEVIKEAIKIVALLVIALAMVYFLYNCETGKYNNTYGSTEGLELSEDDSYFTEINCWTDKQGVVYTMMYANDTRVMYMSVEISDTRYAITPLMNADGTCQVYNED
jgi:hypothetical protein